jgi:hypothetical protein
MNMVSRQTERVVARLRVFENSVRTNPTPKNMSLAFHYGFSTGERRPPIVGPSHLENSGCTPQTFYAKAIPESFSCPKVLGEIFNRL